MKRFFALFSALFWLLASHVSAHNEGNPGDTCRNGGHPHHANFATSGLSNQTPDEWFTIDTYSYPEMTPLSINANEGDSKGHIYPSPTGITIGEAGDYYVQIAAVIQNPDSANTVLIPAFLAVDEDFEPYPNLQIGGVLTLEPEKIDTLNAFGILKDLKEGQRLSIVATNAGYPTPIPIKVVAWRITAFKL